MVKSVDHSGGEFTQECVCSQEIVHAFTGIGFSPKNSRVIILPACSNCNSVECLILNSGTSEHDQLVARVFAEVASS